MNNHPEILAKSLNNGGTSLFDHLKHVAVVAEKTATEINVNPQLAKQAALLHDVGKTHPAFQNGLKGKYDITKISFRHEIASLLFLPIFPIEYWHFFADMIIAHHRSPSKDLKTQGIIDLCNLEGEDEVFERHAEEWENWSKTALEILESLGLISKKISIQEARNAFDFMLEHCKAKKLSWSRLKGMMMGADHLASALSSSTNEITENLFKIPDISYFNSKERQSEIYPLSKISSEDKRPHTIVNAPTGAGKTDFLLRRCKRRIFYTLPFQASINSMYERLKHCFPKKTDIRLLHAASKIILKNNSYEENALPPLIGSSVKILTPHQLAALICGSKGFEAIAIDIAGTDVILDEIHSYSDVAQSMVIEVIKTLLRLDCNIHIGTATMPTALSEEILNILGGEENVYKVKLNDEQLETFNRHRTFKHQSEGSSLDEIEESVSKNEKILIVCNRVDTAQSRFIELKKKYSHIPMMLIHSRFRRTDRSELEKKLREEFNDKAKLPGSCIVVSTQVVEVSLDINFDMMITDAAPLDSLIQRFGRINRYRSEETINKKIIKNIHVLSPSENANDALPYKKEIIYKSYELLPDGEILYEKDLQNKIDEVYPTIEILPIETHLVWEGDQFLLKELCHNPKAVLMDMLKIESATCIRLSDKLEYENGKLETRLSLEIPIPRSSLFRKITHFGRSDYGTKPLIISDELYDPELGLQWKEIETLI